MPAARSRANPAPATRAVGILERGDDTRDAGRDQRVGARRRAPVVRARLERDVGGRAAGAVAGLGQRADLGVGAARAARSRPRPTISPSRTSTQPTHGLGAVRRRAAAPAASACSIASSSRMVPPSGRPAGRGNDDGPADARDRRSGAAAENGVEALSHPDSDRRPRNHTWSAPGWRPGVRGLGHVPDSLAAAPCRHRRSGLSPNPEGSVVQLCSHPQNTKAPPKIATCSIFSGRVLPAPAHRAQHGGSTGRCHGERRSVRRRSRPAPAVASEPEPEPVDDGLIDVDVLLARVHGRGAGGERRRVLLAARQLGRAAGQAVLLRARVARAPHELRRAPQRARAVARADGPRLRRRLGVDVVDVVAVGLPGDRVRRLACGAPDRGRALRAASRSSATSRPRCYCTSTATAWSSRTNRSTASRATTRSITCRIPPRSSPSSRACCAPAGSA